MTALTGKFVELAPAFGTTSSACAATQRSQDGRRPNKEVGIGEIIANPMSGRIA
jgi:hypothetical protein